jgi:hypothetical protein
MASTTENVLKDATEDPKLDVFEDDDEFEEFENEGGLFSPLPYFSCLRGKKHLCKEHHFSLRFFCLYM